MGGVVGRVNGPLVEATGLAGAGMFEVVFVGPHRIPSEVVAIADGTVTLQAYEYTGGLRVGDTVRATGFPLSARLGPGLLGQVFDGLLRPLMSAPVWLSPAERARRADRRWVFTPAVAVGQHVAAGTTLGAIALKNGLQHQVLVPLGSSGQVTWLSDPGEIADDATVARVGERDVLLWEHWPVRRRRPFIARDDAVVPLHTGQRVLDLLFPVGRGYAAAVPGGFGTGKTVLLQQIAKWCDADVIVYVGCGERGNEMADVLAELAELTDPRTGGRLIDRTVILANTSNMPMMAREASIYSAITVAEYYRDMGHEAVVIADSTSRWAEARREFASRTGALPAEEGYPADLASALAAFYERAGRVRTLGGHNASVTIIGAVSPPGGDMAEPVTTATQRFIEALWTLDRDLAYSRHYPAVSWGASFARQVDAVGAWHAEHSDTEWPHRRARAATLLADADRLAALAEIVGTGALPGHERIVMLAGRLIREAVLMQNALSVNDGFSSADKGATLLQLVLDVVDACQRLVERGVPATTIEEFDFGPLIRVRDETGPDDTGPIAACRDEVLRALEELE
ncbi:MAG TPA: V-type ATP synthase subunit A [Jiangellaceae bacterium]|nr:V-type ATP synthase subunit A [Jiangellaceae bacterium]